MNDIDHKEIIIYKMDELWSHQWIYVYDSWIKNFNTKWIVLNMHNDYYC
jgi:hypothetical protein